MFERFRFEFGSKMSQTVEKCKLKKKIEKCLECDEYSYCNLKKYERGENDANVITKKR